MHFLIMSLLYFAPLISYSGQFLPNREHYTPYYDRTDVVIVASTGRSGSTLLTEAVLDYPDFEVMKTHLLPPERHFKGKILFIFSDPDQAAESIFHMTLTDSYFGSLHFQNFETSDLAWFQRLGDTTNQTIDHNLLKYDALGCYQQLKHWLITDTKPASKRDASILAIKYEHLWEPKTIKAIEDFLGIESLNLPDFRSRGGYEMSAKEIVIRKRYNIGPPGKPLYRAYYPARVLWLMAPPIQYLKIR